MAIKYLPKGGLSCSARDCVQPAKKSILWKNPKIHHGRHKTWLSCAEHIEYLESYLAYRGFPTKTVDIAQRDKYQANDI